MGFEEAHEWPLPDYRGRMIIEVQGYIALFSGDNLFRDHLDGFGVRAAALKSYQQELKELYALPQGIDDSEVEALHQQYEEKRRSLLE